MSATIHLQVELLKSSYKRDPNLKLNHQETIVSDKVIKFYHTENDFSKMIRAYIAFIFIFSYFFYVPYLLSYFKQISIYDLHMLKLNLVTIYYLFILISFIYDIEIIL